MCGQVVNDKSPLIKAILNRGACGYLEESILEGKWVYILFHYLQEVKF